MRVTMPRKEHLGAKLDPNLVESIRNAAWWIGRGLSLNSILEEGAIAEVARLKKLKNDGEPFPERDEDLKRLKGTPAGPRTGERKATVSFRMYDADQEELRNAAAALQVSVTSIIEDGARRLLAKLERQHNGGHPFAPREGDLPGATPRRED